MVRNERLALQLLVDGEAPPHREKVQKRQKRKERHHDKETVGDRTSVEGDSHQGQNPQQEENDSVSFQNNYLLFRNAGLSNQCSENAVGILLGEACLRR